MVGKKQTSLQTFDRPSCLGLGIRHKRTLPSGLVPVYQALNRVRGDGEVNHPEDVSD
jgi:hypothetical protein